MTTLVLNYSTSLLETLLKSLKGILTSIMIGWRNSRQRSVNWHVAGQIIQYAKSDYPGHTQESLFHMLNEKTGIK